jgi:hypothetical protein
MGVNVRYAMTHYKTNVFGKRFVNKQSIETNKMFHKIGHLSLNIPAVTLQADRSHRRKFSKLKKHG